mgnify:CR=1 FL=1
MATNLSAAELTRQQELGSAWILRRALKDNKTYTTWEDILDDPKYEELGGKKGIYPTVDKEWLQTFFLQQKKMLEEFSNPRFTEFNREYGFMKYISDLVKNKFGISKSIAVLRKILAEKYGISRQIMLLARCICIACMSALIGS